ncbi:MAG: AAA family ATPase [Acetobacteraceae bacterium]|nr:AAA family ATPase [Acetobacteraceae bacterium]
MDTIQPTSAVEGIGYPAFFGFKSKPFIAPRAQADVFISRDRQAAIMALRHALFREAPFMAVVGEKGIGKSALAEAILPVLASRRARILRLNNPAGAPIGARELKTKLIVKTTGALDSSHIEATPDMLARQNDRERRVILIVDDAETLQSGAMRCLAELATAMQTGRTTLHALLMVDAAGWERFRADWPGSASARIDPVVHLAAFDSEDVRAYTDFQLSRAGASLDATMTEAAVIALEDQANGSPARIDTILDRALSFGAMRGIRPLTAQTVELAAAATPPQEHRVQPDPIREDFFRSFASDQRALAVLPPAYAASRSRAGSLAPRSLWAVGGLVFAGLAGMLGLACIWQPDLLEPVEEYVQELSSGVTQVAAAVLRKEAPPPRQLAPKPLPAIARAVAAAPARHDPEAALPEPDPVAQEQPHPSRQAKIEPADLRSSEVAAAADLPPVPDPPTPAQVTARVDAPSAALVPSLLRRGDAMMEAGDIHAARLLYEHAARAGSGAAALAAGKAFDPRVLAPLGAVSAADPVEATRWYTRAYILGEPEARQRLMDLAKQTATSFSAGPK